jgi:hypothetical protein
MSAPWIAVVVCLWVLFVAMALVMAGVLRRVATALEAVPAGPRKHEMPSGPPRGSGLPAMEVRREDGSHASLSELPGPFVLAVLTSHCAPCVAIADRLRADPPLLASLDGVVVVTDPDGPARLDLGPTVTVLVDPHDQVMASLQLPGTPFVIAVGADSTVQTAQLLTGPGQLSTLLDRVRSSSTAEPTAAEPALAEPSPVAS